MKNDARVRYTKQALRDSLLRCLEGKSISQVTVKEVCDGAELNRATFYNHYRDCYDLLEQLENQMIEEFWDSLHLMSSLNTEKLVSSIMDMIDKNRDLCQVLIFDRGDDSLVRKMVEIAKEQSLELWKRYLTRAGDEELDMLFTCLASGLLNVIIQSYGRDDREKIVNFINFTVENCLTPYL